MKKVLCLTHENFSKTAVAKAMFLDVILKLPNKFKCTIVSANNSGGDIIENGINYYYFKRKKQGQISFLDLLNLLKSFIKISKLIKKTDIIYIRSYPMVLLFILPAKIFNKKVVFDTRGLFFEELFDSGKIKSNIIRAFFDKIESLLLKFSDKVICVSNAQKDFYNNKVFSNEKYEIIYNGAIESENVKVINKQNKYKIGYVGSLIKWHCPTLMASVLFELEKMTNFSFHCVTTDIDNAEIYFKNIKDISIYSHDYRKQPIKFDLGLCFISSSISKEVCFPVKFSEYLVAKTPIAFSNNVSVCNDIHKEFSVGIPISINTSAEVIAKEIYQYLQSSHKEVTLPKELSFDTMLERVTTVLENV